MGSNDLTATLYFAAAIRAVADDSLTRLLPLNLLKVPLSPHKNFSLRILFSLQALGMIEPELSISNAVDWLSARDWIEVDVQTLTWRISWLPEVWQDRTTLTQQLLQDVELSESVLEVLLAIWEDLALAEVVEYASWSLAKSGYNPQWAEAGAASFRDALRVFSAAQVMHLVGLAIRSVASTHQRGGMVSSRLGEVLAAGVGSFSRRAVVEKWIVRHTPRPVDLPVSTIASIFAHELTRLDDSYLTRTPSIVALLDTTTHLRSVH